MTTIRVMFRLGRYCRVLTECGHSFRVSTGEVKANQLFIGKCIPCEECRKAGLRLLDSSDKERRSLTRPAAPGTPRTSHRSARPPGGFPILIQGRLEGVSDRQKVRQAEQAVEGRCKQRDS
jgi:hypothetical protein